MPALPKVTRVSVSLNGSYRTTKGEREHLARPSRHVAGLSVQHAKREEA